MPTPLAITSLTSPERAVTVNSCANSSIIPNTNATIDAFNKALGKELLKPLLLKAINQIKVQKK